MVVTKQSVVSMGKLAVLKYNLLPHPVYYIEFSKYPSVPKIPWW